MIFMTAFFGGAFVFCIKKRHSTVNREKLLFSGFAVFSGLLFLVCILYWITEFHFL